MNELIYLEPENTGQIIPDPDAVAGHKLPAQLLGETERLTLRHLIPEDLEILFELHSDPEVMRYIRQPDQNRAQTQAKMDIIARDKIKYPNLGLFPAHLRSNGRFIGWMLIKYLQYPDLIEIGYRLHVPFWGQGYATEGARFMMKYGFETLGLPRLCGVTDPGNAGSKRVLEKCRMQYTGIRHFYESDLCYYEAVNPESPLKNPKSS